MAKELEVTITLKGIESVVAVAALKELKERASNNEIPGELEFLNAETISGVCDQVEARIVNLLKIYKKHNENK